MKIYYVLKRGIWKIQMIPCGAYYENTYPNSNIFLDLISHIKSYCVIKPSLTLSHLCFLNVVIVQKTVKINNYFPYCIVRWSLKVPWYSKHLLCQLGYLLWKERLEFLLNDISNKLLQLVFHLLPLKLVQASYFIDFDFELLGWLIL